MEELLKITGPNLFGPYFSVSALIIKQFGRLCRPSGSWGVLVKATPFTRVIEAECLGQLGNRLGDVSEK
jgi:hypothetical protein